MYFPINMKIIKKNHLEDGEGKICICSKPGLFQMSQKLHFLFICIFNCQPPYLNYDGLKNIGFVCRENCI